MNFFNENNLIFVALNKIGDIILANLLFILCSIPLVTIGPSLTALYHCMLRTVKGNNNGTVKTFFRAFRQSFRQSLIVWLGLVVVGLLLFLDTRFLLQTGSVVILALYIFPVIAAFTNTLRNLLKNAFLFAFMHFPSTLTIAVISILPMYMTYHDLKLLPLYACCWFFFGFGLTAYINSFFFYRMFRPYLETSENEEAISVIDDEHPQ